MLNAYPVDNFLQAFVSEYAVTGNDAGRGSLLKALAEAGFLIGLERNRYVETFVLKSKAIDISAC